MFTGYGMLLLVLIGLVPIFIYALYYIFFQKRQLRVKRLVEKMKPIIETRVEEALKREEREKNKGQGPQSYSALSPQGQGEIKSTSWADLKKIVDDLRKETGKGPSESIDVMSFERKWFDYIYFDIEQREQKSWDEIQKEAVKKFEDLVQRGEKTIRLEDFTQAERVNTYQLNWMYHPYYFRHYAPWSKDEQAIQYLFSLEERQLKALVDILSKLQSIKKAE
jgi:hypothetical protein